MKFPDHSKLYKLKDSSSSTLFETSIRVNRRYEARNPRSPIYSRLRSFPKLFRWRKRLFPCHSTL